MNISGITWRGESIQDVELLPDLPLDLLGLLTKTNGFILHNGALHVRGACLNPEWHSLRQAWFGPDSFSKLYKEVEATDIPFAEDQFGDQFLMRNGGVFRLETETGQVQPLCESLQIFLSRVEEDIVTFLNVGLNHPLEPGQLLHAYPPFCVESKSGVSLKPCPASEVILFHADLARQIRDVPDGMNIEFKIKDP